MFVTVRKRSCGKVMFSQACVKNSVHRGDVCQTHTPPRADTPWIDAPRQKPLGRHPLGRHPHGQTPQTGRHPPFRGRHPSHQQTATAADGMHPTGMHSCVFLILLLLVHVMTTGYVSVNLIQRIQIELRSTKKWPLGRNLHNTNFVLNSIGKSIKVTILPLMYTVYFWSKNYEFGTGAD